MRGHLIGAAIAALLLSGCASAPHQITDREDFVAEGTREFKGETAERVIKAAEIVLKTSDPSDFEFRYNLDGFEGLRRYVVYAVLATAVGREKWDFRAVRSEAGAIRASVSISEAGRTTGGYSSTPYEGAMASIPLYRLFWTRVEYILGRRPEWISCQEALEAERAKNTNALAALGGLCGPTSDGRDAPAPPVLPPLPVAAAPSRIQHAQKR
jgi:hypothetical protein